MAKLLLILVGANSPTQVGSIVASPPVAVDEAKMAQVTVVIKSIMRKSHIYKSKDNTDDE